MPLFVKIVMLIIVVFTKTGDVKELTLPLPQGTSLADCIADHTPAMDANLSGDVVKFGWTCVEINVPPTSQT